MSYSVYKQGGSVCGHKSYDSKFDAYDCDSECPKKKCCKEEEKHIKIEMKCKPCNDPCDPCFRPYITKCYGADGCPYYDLCVCPDKCLMNDNCYQMLFCELKKSILFHRIDLLLKDLDSEDKFNELVVIAEQIVDRVTDGRVLITLPDGTVVYDTFTDCTYADFLAKTCGENHNSRVAIINSQIDTCGVGYEQKKSTTTGDIEKYVAIRLGEYLNNHGSIRLSKKIEELI